MEKELRLQEMIEPEIEMSGWMAVSEIINGYVVRETSLMLTFSWKG
jgi:hypothetical protein